MPSRVAEKLSCYKFADDGTLMVFSENLMDCYHIMQEVCEALSTWCIENKLQVNCDVNKTEAMILQTANPSNNITIPELKINGRSIKYVKSTKVLGIIIDDELSFKQHASQKLNES